MLETPKGVPSPSALNAGGVGLFPIGVDLVDDEQHRDPDALQPPCEERVFFGDPGEGVDHQQDEVGIGGRPIRLDAGERLDAGRVR